MMNVIVTGATGFLGAAAVRELLDEGHRVTAVSRPNSANAKRLPQHAALSVVELDAAEIERLPKLLQKEADREFVWLQMAWGGTRVEDRSEPAAQQESIRRGLKALETAEELGCRKFVFAGSQAEYGCHSEAITEETLCSPVTEYGKAKLEFSNTAKELCKSKKIEYIHTRIFSVYGLEDHPWSLIPSCIRTWGKGECMELGACTQLWNYLYITDAAKAFAALLKYGTEGIYNLAGRDTRVLRNYVEELHELCGGSGSFRFGEQVMRAGGPVSLNPVVDKLTHTTGWEPQVSFREGIQSMLSQTGLI